MKEGPRSYRGSGTVGGKLGCALSAVIGIPLLFIALFATSYGDCLPNTECRTDFDWRLVGAALGIAAAVGFVSRFLINAVVEGRSGSLFTQKLPQQRQVFRNNGSNSLEVMIEMIPDRYVLQPGDEMVVLADAPPTNEGFTVNAYDGGLQVYAAWDMEPAVTINGQPAEPDWSTPGPNSEA